MYSKQLNIINSRSFDTIFFYFNRKTDRCERLGTDVVQRSTGQAPVNKCVPVSCLVAKILLFYANFESLVHAVTGGGQDGNYLLEFASISRVSFPGRSCDTPDPWTPWTNYARCLSWWGRKTLLTHCLGRIFVTKCLFEIC